MCHVDVKVFNEFKQIVYVSEVFPEGRNKKNDLCGRSPNFYEILSSEKRTKRKKKFICTLKREKEKRKKERV